MGVVANNCRTSKVPAMKSKAEALAVRAQESLVEVYLGQLSLIEQVNIILQVTK